MKKLTISIVIVLFIVPLCIAQSTIKVADNNFNAPTGANVFPTLQEAINAALAGDTIHVQPSPTAYGNAVIDKQLTLIGIGFNVDKDIPLTSIVGNIALTNSLDGASQSDGTVIMGLEMGYLYPGSNTGGPSFTLGNIKVDNCIIRTVDARSNANHVNDFEISNCNIWGGNGYGNGIETNYKIDNFLLHGNLIMYDIVMSSSLPSANVIITNNILYGAIRIDAAGSMTAVLNNDFIGATGTAAAFASTFLDNLVSNNIFYGATPSISASGSLSDFFQRNVFTNNVVWATGDNTMPPTGGVAGNTETGSIIASPDFEMVPASNNWDAINNFTLKTGSPAIGASSEAGEDIGISGGMHPMTATNFSNKTSPIPVIQILNTSGVINQGDDLPTRIKANSN